MNFIFFQQFKKRNLKNCLVAPSIFKNIRFINIFFFTWTKWMNGKIFFQKTYICYIYYGIRIVICRCESWINILKMIVILAIKKNIFQLHFHHHWMDKQQWIFLTFQSIELIKWKKNNVKFVRFFFG